jgi:hypothetical protein
MSDKIGRPSTYSKEKAKDICSMIESGMTLVSICALDDMPAISTAYEWIDSNSDFADNYARARQRQADTFAAMVMTEAFNANDAQIGRLRIDALKWTASRLAPKKYGDKIEVETQSQQNFKISFTVPERDNATLMRPATIALNAITTPVPQIIDVSPESIPESAGLQASDYIDADEV